MSHARVDRAKVWSLIESVSLLAAILGWGLIFVLFLTRIGR